MSSAPEPGEISLLEAALAYARRGLPVFPCHPETKQPLTAHGLKDASADEGAVRAWWAKHADAMIGVPTGAASKTWVLDVDDPAVFEGACKIALPTTRRCETGKGYHLYFKHDPAREVRNTQRKRKDGDGERPWPLPDLPGAEVRGEGGYVIVPPSVHPSGRRYQWASEAAAVEAPAELLAIVRKTVGRAKSACAAMPTGSGVDTHYGLAALEAECAAIRKASDGEQEGTLNDAALKLGGLVAGGGLSQTTARARLIGAGLEMPSYNPRDPWTTDAIVAKVDRGLADGAASPRAPKEGAIHRHAAGAARSAEIYDMQTGEVREPSAGVCAGVEPVDLWARYEAPALPTNLLPDVIGMFAVRHGEVMGADPAGLAMAALTVCAAAIDDAICVQVKRNDPSWRESPRLWVGLVGVPSMKKTPIMTAALRPLRRIDANLMRSYTDKRNAYELLQPKERKAAERPPQERRIIADATVEAAQEVLKDSPRGVLSAQDELSGWFGAMDKYAPGKGAMADRSFYLTAFNGGPYSVSRIQRGAFFIPNCSISLLGGIQPEPLRAIANDMHDDGLIQRLLPILLRTSDVGKDEPSGSAVVDYERLIERLELMQPPRRAISHDPDGDRPKPLRFDDRAAGVRGNMEARHLQLVKALEHTSPKLAAHFGKYDGLFARLCVLWHCIEHADELTPPEEIGLPVTERVAAFMEQFLRPMAVAFYAGVLGLSAGHDDLMALASYILARRVYEVKAREVQSSSQSFRHWTADQVRMLCEKLEAFGWLERAEPAPKSNTPRWMVNPAVHDLFAEQGERERLRREAAGVAFREALAS